MSNAMIYVGIAVGVLAMAGAVTYGTINQQNYVPYDAIPAPATEQGAFSSSSGLGAQLNKEQWHADPFADEAAEVRSNAGQ